MVVRSVAALVRGVAHGGRRETNVEVESSRGRQDRGQYMAYCCFVACLLASPDVIGLLFPFVLSSPYRIFHLTLSIYVSFNLLIVVLAPPYSLCHCAGLG